MGQLCSCLLSSFSSALAQNDITRSHWTLQLLWINDFRYFVFCFHAQRPPCTLLFACMIMSIFILLPEVRTSPYLRPSMGYGSHLDTITLLLRRKTEIKGKKNERKWACTYVAMAKLNRNTPSTWLYSCQFLLLQEQNCRKVWTSCGGTCYVLDKRYYWTPERAQRRALHCQNATESRVMWLL